MLLQQRVHVVEEMNGKGKQCQGTRKKHRSRIRHQPRIESLTDKLFPSATNTKLSWVVSAFNTLTWAWQDTPTADHVRRLWRLPQEERMRLWHHHGPFEGLLQLSLGGERSQDKCPLDVQELQALFPEGNLCQLRSLSMSSLSSITDPALRHLSTAGCGENVTTLHLEDLVLTDYGLESLAEGGCGKSLTTLHLESVGISDFGIECLVRAGCGPLLTELHLQGLGREFSDHGLRVLANAGCGARLASLTLAELKEGVTDDGIRSLARAGCGSQLTALSLECKFHGYFPC